MTFCCASVRECHPNGACYQRHPEIQRLATWDRLERADSKDPIEAIVASNAAKVKAIAEAQRADRLTTSFEPAVLLGLVLTLSGT